MPFGSDAEPGEDDCDFDEHPVASAATRVRKLAVRLTSTLPSNSRNFEYKTHGCAASTVLGRGVVSRDERRMRVPKRSPSAYSSMLQFRCRPPCSGCIACSLT